VTTLIYIFVDLDTSS